LPSRLCLVPWSGGDRPGAPWPGLDAPGTPARADPLPSHKHSRDRHREPCAGVLAGRRTDISVRAFPGVRGPLIFRPLRLLGLSAGRRPARAAWSPASTEAACRSSGGRARTSKCRGTRTVSRLSCRGSRPRRESRATGSRTHLGLLDLRGEAGPGVARPRRPGDHLAPLRAPHDGCAARRLAQGRTPPEVTGRAERRWLWTRQKRLRACQSRADRRTAWRRRGVRRRRGCRGRTTRACRYGDEHGTSQRSGSSDGHDAPGHDASRHEAVCSFDSTAAPEARATQRQRAVAEP